jgi:hypothetical protein
MARHTVIATKTRKHETSGRTRRVAARARTHDAKSQAGECLNGLCFRGVSSSRRRPVKPAAVRPIDVGTDGHAIQAMAVSCFRDFVAISLNNHKTRNCAQSKKAASSGGAAIRRRVRDRP